MKQIYQQPLVTVSQIDTEPLLGLSQNGTTVVVDPPTIIPDDDASGAASRTYSVWDDDEDSERDEDEV